MKHWGLLLLIWAIMPVKLTAAIPAEANEIILDRIEEILVLEIPNQATLLEDPEVNATVFKERISRLSYSECPAVNLSLQKVAYSQHGPNSVSSECTFQIAIATTAPAEADVRGDTSAAIKAKKIARLIRQILESPHYQLLNFSAGFIASRKINAMDVVELEENTNDSENLAMVQLQFSVVAADAKMLHDTGELNSTQSSLQIEETDKGHLIQTNLQHGN